MSTFSVLVDVERTATIRLLVEAEDIIDANNQAIDDVLLRGKGDVVDEWTRNITVVECEPA